MKARFWTSAFKAGAGAKAATSVTSSSDPTTNSFEPHHSALGKAPAWRLELGSDLAKI
jgi:hypothetical protein